MNWLPPDSSLAIDYDNIVGLGIGSLDFFSLPNSTTDLAGAQIMQQEPVTTSLVQHDHQINTSVRRDADFLTDDSRTPWDNAPSRLVKSYTSFESPRAAAYTVTPSDTPGGLYATSVNGARMPCTVRARRASRLIPGARPIRSLKQVQAHSHDGDDGLEFPDVSHIVVDPPTTSSSNDSIHGVPSLSDITYNAIMQAFKKLCLDDGASFPSYKTSRFPGLSSLHLCIRLYFENFDQIMPLLHKTVALIDDYWLLALAVAAIGCQYVEADEYAQMVEPLHELLRRAIAVEFTAAKMRIVGRSKHGLAFAQAVVLSQVGMLYAGSARLLHFAKAQHSALIELARALAAPVTAFEFAQSDAQYGSNVDTGSATWELAMLHECKRRVICSVVVSRFELQQSCVSH
jgi:hypothetical protein